MFHCEHIFLRILPFQRIFCLLLPVVWRLNKIGIDLKQVLTLRDFWTTMRQVSWLKILFIRSQSREQPSSVSLMFPDVAHVYKEHFYFILPVRIRCFEVPFLSCLVSSVAIYEEKARFSITYLSRSLFPLCFLSLGIFYF